LQHASDLLRQRKHYFHPKAFACSRVKSRWQPGPGIQD
jgi:hypothetical protein